MIVTELTRYVTVSQLIRSCWTEPGDLLLKGDQARKLIECGVLHAHHVPDDNSPDCESIVSLAERCPAVSIAIGGVPHPEDSEAVLEWTAKAVSDPNVAFPFAIVGCVDPPTFFAHIFAVVRKAYWVDARLFRATVEFDAFL